MSFVLYDVETTGLNKRFDQIVHFAAVRTDANLRIVDRVQGRCRLMPHIVPSPEAMHITGLDISQLTDPSLPSHFEMIAQVRQRLQSWCPAVFLGFNSLAFDEEFLRHAFYQCLHGAYLTNTEGSTRADVLNLCRLTAALRPDVLRPAIGDDGRPLFKLKLLAEANGLTVALAHDAMADVITMHALCQIIRSGAPEIWSQFLRFSQRATVDAFVADEDVFLVSESIGNRHQTRAVMRVGQHSEQAIRHYCLDLTADVEGLRKLPYEDLVALCKTPGRPVVTVRSNAAPTLWALYEASAEHIAPFDENQLVDRAASVRDDRPLLEKLRNAAQDAEKVYPPSPHVEDQLYGFDFPSQPDKALMHSYQGATWERRLEMARQFQDPRYRRLAMRAVYFDKPHLFPEEVRPNWEAEVRKRLMAPVEAGSRWRSIPAARQEAERLIAGGLSGEDLARQVQLLAYLKDQANRMDIAQSLA
jgi:exodeoxyribonuclease-1